MLGRVARPARAATIGLKKPGGRLVLVGRRGRELGGSLFRREIVRSFGSVPPRVHARDEREAIHLVSRLVEEGLVAAAHDIAAGGLLVAIAEMIDQARNPSVGASIELRLESGDQRPEEYLFSESGGFLLESRGEDPALILKRVEQAGVFASAIGSVDESGRVSIRLSDETLLDLPRERVREARRGALAPFFTGV
jgi:phosphoribosylformylglycinamidine synthase